MGKADATCPTAAASRSRPAPPALLSWAAHSLAGSGGGPAAGGLAHGHLETRHARSAARSLRRLPGATRSRSCGRPARAGAGLAADRVASGHGSTHQVLVLEPARGGLVAALGPTGEAALAGGAELSAAQRRNWDGSLPRAPLARPASTCERGLP